MAKHIRRMFDVQVVVQMDNVRYLRTSLQREGFPVEHTPSHIIPIRISDPFKGNETSDLLIQEHGHYLQAINYYPTVALGEEKLSLAPTPWHTRPMMDILVRDMKKVWQQLEMPLSGSQCKEGCTFCRKPIFFDRFESRVRGCATEVPCAIRNCTQMVAAAH